MRTIIVLILSLSLALSAAAQHPFILMNKEDVAAIRLGTEQYPLLQSSFAETKAKADLALSAEISVPVPADGGGGLTHEQHKKNYQDMLQCALTYQVTAEKKYAAFVRDVLLEYARQYEHWPLHPARKEHQVPGKIFWQNLNDCVWAVYTIQAYDLVYDALEPSDRKVMEEHLFRPVLHFLTVDSKKTFDKVHNHGTWCAAAVGMIGYVLQEQRYVDMALYGSKLDRKSGYFAMLDELFSPDGYYTEGPYYQRYAMLPFILFARAIHVYQPELKIYGYRDSILAKAVNTTLQLTYTNGAFFPINDAIKDKTFRSEEIVYCVDIAYADIAADHGLLDIAAKQGRVMISAAGLRVAKDIAAAHTQPFSYTSGLVKDGRNGEEGALAIMRSGTNTDQQCVLLKGAGHGMGHGHFDQLNMLYYDHGVEVFSDYGAARFLNIVTKHGGDYLPENRTWGKTTVAHNTVVVDRATQFDHDVEQAQKYHSDILYFHKNDTLTVASFLEGNAYPGTRIRRTVLLYQPDKTKKALLIDINDISASSLHQYDLPYWYQGHIVDASFPLKRNAEALRPMDSMEGFRHLWWQQQEQTDGNEGYISVLNNNRFYTTSFAGTGAVEVNLVELGANDPEYNLRSEKAFILSRNKASDAVFFTVTESHGRVNPTEETATGIDGSVNHLKVESSTSESIALSFRCQEKTVRILVRYNQPNQFIDIK